MIYSIAADLVVLLHLSFILFVLFGGVLNIFWSHAWYIHLPAVAWGLMLELSDWVCPLTPLENYLRIAGGGSTYTSGFVEHYIMPIIYPAGLTREMQVIFAVIVLIINLVVYIWLYKKTSLKKRRSP